MKRPVSRSSRDGRQAPKPPARVLKITRAKLPRQPKTSRTKKSVSKRGLGTLGSLIRKPNLQAVKRLKVDRETIRRFQGQSRQTKVIAISALSSVLALLLLVLATIFTPLLAVEKIRITGLSKVSLKEVTAAVKPQLGIPLALVSQQSVADQLSRFTLIESFSLVSELPHTLHIAISERQPICIVDIGGASYLYDPAGIRLGQATYKDTYPRVLITGEPKNSASFSEAIDVLLALPADLLPRLSEIDAKSKDDVTMQLRGFAGQKIIWGDASQSALKSKVLAALIANQKTSDRVTFDVSSPSAPVVRYR